MVSKNNTNKPSTLDDLTRCSRHELEELFSKGDTEDPPSGYTRGLSIALPGTSLGRMLGKYVNATSWKGKYFEPDGGQVWNIITPLAIRAALGDMRIEDGILDGKPSIVIDYSNTIAFGLPVRDEIRRINDGLYLGRAFQGPIPTVFFGLSNKLKPKKAVYHSRKVEAGTGGASELEDDSSLAKDLEKGDLIVDVVGDSNAPGIKEIAVSGIFEAPLDEVWKVITDVGSYTEFQPQVAITEIKEKTPEKIVAYHKLKVPMPLPEVWYVMQYNIGNKGLMTFEMLKGSPKVAKGSFKVVQYKGSEERTLGVYSMLVDLGLPLPDLVINQVTKLTLPEALESYRKRVYENMGEK